MIEVADNQKEILVPLFHGIQDSLIISCIQNYFGSAWVDRCDAPASGVIVVGDFVFLAGEPSEDILRSVQNDFRASGMVLVPDGTGWHSVIEGVFGKRCRRVERYAIKKEGDIFDRELLKKYIGKLPEGYVLKEIDASVYDDVMSKEWSRDFCRQYADWEHFRDRGMGVVIYKDDEIVSGASSYTSYREGIEIQITTREDYRKRGLALVCASALVLKALQCHLYPNWDAANMASVGIAEKLGYHYDKPYTAYDVWKEDAVRIRFPEPYGQTAEQSVQLRQP